MGRIIGTLIIILALLTIFVLTCFAVGLKNALIIWAAALLLTGLIILGACLMAG